ncbi:hypothetical protein LSH36_583g02097 [Paralvinella palmiformis]|uniref:10 kDa heat shock protein, mitochondrial n=1 Tax=Paralvinella palmiformis TaxID=53620 RepID=A0AAD9J703_9ANNE|nr:hypothetical protein LSH36_583g02097 [Paralvinella palmiformis]
MIVTPIGDRVVVKAELEETKTKGGIIIPETAKEKTQIGLVTAIGDDVDKAKVAVGNRVLFDKYAGTQIKIDNKDHLVLNISDVLAKVK